MKTIVDYVGGLELGKVQKFKNMAVVPLIGTDSELEYMVFDEAINSGLKISETNDVGSLHASNKTGLDVLVLQGEYVIGGKQNRMMKRNMLLAKDYDGFVPVRCVEKNRWDNNFEVTVFPNSLDNLGDHINRRRTPFENPLEIARITGRTHPYNGKKVDGPGGPPIINPLDDFERRDGIDDCISPIDTSSRSFMSSGKRAVSSMNFMAESQSGVWGEVHNLMGSLGVNSKTADFNAVYEQKQGDIDEYLKHFPIEDGIVGIAVMVRKNGVDTFGVDIFDQHSTIDKNYQKLLESYAISALGVDEYKNPTKKEISVFMDYLKQEHFQERKAVSLGRDFDIKGNGIQGSALIDCPAPNGVEAKRAQHMVECQPIYINFGSVNMPNFKGPVIRPMSERQNIIRTGFYRN